MYGDEVDNWGEVRNKFQMGKEREVKLRNNQWERMTDKDHKSSNNDGRRKVNTGGLRGKEHMNTPRLTGQKDVHAGSRHEMSRSREDDDDEAY